MTVKSSSKRLLLLRTCVGVDLADLLFEVVEEARVRRLVGGSA